MRTISKLCLAASVLSAVMLAQTVVRKVPATNQAASSQDTKTASANPQPSSGHLDGQNYSNDYFAFQYKIPDGLSPFMMPMPQRDPADKTFVLFSAKDSAGRVLVMMADRALPYGGLADGNAYLRKVTRYMSAQGFEVLRESALYTYAGLQFFRADYHKGEVYQSAIFTVRSGYALGLTAAGGTPEQANELCDSLKSLTFTGPEVRVKTQAITVEREIPPGMPHSAQAIGHVMVAPPREGSKNLPSWTSGVQRVGCEQPPDQNAPTRVRISGGVAEGIVVSKVPPKYPPLARQARIQGSVVLHAIIGCDGAVRELRTISGHPMLVQAAIDAVRQWRYRRYVLNGKPVETETTVRVNFSLPNDSQ